MTRIVAVAAVTGMGLLTGCSALGQHGTAQPSATVTVTATAAATPAVTPAATAVATATPASSASAATSAAAPPAVPTLGRVAGVFEHGTGFGSVRPAKIFNGGDPTGLVSGITWNSWGGHTAVGTGTSEYVGPGQSVATGSQASARVVAFNLGYCAGKLMYRSLEWYFPGHGQAFSSTHYQDICAGSYVPAS
jgi:hypothetical protein